MSKFVKPLSLDTAPAGSLPMLEGIQKNFGMIPNLLGNFAHNPKVLSSYLGLGENFAGAGFNPLEQQIVLLTVSMENGCHYCVAAHSAISAMSKLDEKVINNVRSGDTLEDKKLEALRTFTKRIVSAKGKVDASDIKKFLTAGYSKEQVLAVVLGVAMKTLSNYVNHVAQTELDEAFKPFSWTK